MSQTSLSALLDRPLPAARANVFEMTEAAEEAVLRPVDPGGLSHPLRAALAARISRLHGEEALAVLYAAGAGDQAPLADPATPGEGRAAAVCAFVDKVAARTAEAGAGDIETLREAGLEDADVVRLAELGAFMAYKIRTLAGLRLLTGGSA